MGLSGIIPLAGLFLMWVKWEKTLITKTWDVEVHNFFPIFLSL